ncbi:hypothetical protein EI94DRAFT_96323 [Lactarius quietus]|nr:hypothetical protein EI94DRAFT_96323 [Lactarius quietus]
MQVCSSMFAFLTSFNNCNLYFKLEFDGLNTLRKKTKLKPREKWFGPQLGPQGGSSSRQVSVTVSNSPPKAIDYQVLRTYRFSPANQPRLIENLSDKREYRLIGASDMRESTVQYGGEKKYYLSGLTGHRIQTQRHINFHVRTNLGRFRRTRCEVNSLKLVTM